MRGTKGPQDIGQDVMLGAVGHTTNRIGDELRVILDSTDRDSIVDIAAHSLGTGFVLEGYNANREIYNRVHETYLYNPAYSPFLRGLSDQYEQDENVRYFINLGDPVSIGGIGHKPPANVVFRQPSLNMHSLSQWAGPGAKHVQYEPLLQRQQTIHEQSPFTRRRPEEEAQYYEEESTKDDVRIPESSDAQDLGPSMFDFGGTQQKRKQKKCTPPDPGRPPLAPTRVYYIDDDFSEFFSEDPTDIVMRIAPELGTLNSTKKDQ